jgi:hypothetical protein
MKKTTMKPMIFLSIAAMFAVGVANGHAQGSVKMIFSGTSANTVINLQQPNTSGDEDNFAGTGTLGSFTVRIVRAISNSPSASNTCSSQTELFFTETAGAAIFRFNDGSLLYATLTQGGDCIDFQANDAHCTVSFQITGGTGRLANASGTLTFTELVVPVIADALGNPVFFAATGKFTGTVSGVGGDQDQDGRQ